MCVGKDEKDIFMCLKCDPPFTIQAYGDEKRKMRKVFN